MRRLTAVPAGPPTFSWFGGPPQGPGLPFGSPVLAVYDSLRVVCILAVAATTVLAAVLIIRRQGVIGQRIRLLAETGLAWVAMTIEIEHFGDYANLRLIFVLMVTMAAAWGNYLGIRYETPPSPHWHKRVTEQP